MPGTLPNERERTRQAQQNQTHHASIPIHFTPLPQPIARSLSPEEQLARMNLLDDLMSDIGMGKFQKQLLFEVQDQNIGILSSSMFVGMMFGAMFWGMLSDVYGRKQAFNFTLIVTTIFGIAASFANSYWLLCVLILCLGFGVDGALFLEFTPKKNQYLLTFLSIFFSFGAVATSLLGYVLLPKYSCETTPPGGCNGKGWRYMLLALGGVTMSMVVGRVILFRLEESPKFLLNHNRHDEAAMVLRRIFKINHNQRETSGSEVFEENIETLTSRFNLTSSETNSSAEESFSEDSDSGSDTRNPAEMGPPTVTAAASARRMPGELRQRQEPVPRGKYKLLLYRQRRQFRHKVDLAMERLRPLMSPRFRLSTILIWIIWALVAFAYTAFNVFYPKFLQEHGEGGNQSLRQVYQDILIYSAAGVPGSVIATVLVEGRLGRRYTMAVSTIGTAIACALFVALKSHAAMTIFSAILGLLSTLNYAVLYSYTPEVFPSDIRGTACGVAAAMSRLAGIVSPLIVGIMLTVSTYFPLYASCVTFFIS
ncbi:hypothetical protein EDD11_008252, partial [Mortierella claussenii]